jgi:hypothetical protein
VRAIPHYSKGAELEDGSKGADPMTTEREHELNVNRIRRAIRAIELTRFEGDSKLDMNSRDILADLRILVEDAMLHKMRQLAQQTAPKK